YVNVGADCAAKLYDGADFGASRFRKTLENVREASAGKRKALAYLTDKGLTKAWELWIANMDDLPVDESRPRYNYDTKESNGFQVLADVLTVRDIVGKL